VFYPNAGKLLANGKKMFVTAPARIEVVKNEAPDAHPPPQTPVITLWGTWSDATVYYTEKFEMICFVANELIRDGASSVGLLQEVFND
jgi:hypothetical protein